MNTVVITKTYAEPPVCEKEILRYAGCKTADDGIISLMRSAVEDVRGRLSYNVCYRELPIKTIGGTCDFECFSVQSSGLAKNLHGCDKAIVFAATVGIEIDRLIYKYGRISPSKALMLQAIGAERIEALCDVFCDDMEKEVNRSLKPRFSPGYGDLSLDLQKDIFDILDCRKHIGVSLNESMLISPSKSVTAFVGITDNNIGAITKTNKCGLCGKTDCSFRSIT